MPDLDQHTLTRNSCLILVPALFSGDLSCFGYTTSTDTRGACPGQVSIHPNYFDHGIEVTSCPTRGQKENLGAAPRALVVLLNSGKVEFAEQLLSRLDVCYLWSKDKNLWFKCQWTQWLPVSSTEEEKGDVRAPLQPFVS